MAVNLREEARKPNRYCTVRSRVCNGVYADTCLAHLPSGKKGVKADDRHACISCDACHKWLDEQWVLDDYYDIGINGYAKQEFRKINRDTMFFKAVIITQKIWIKEGLM